MKKIAMYELLSMIKDNKAPRRIIFYEKLWLFDGDDIDYKDNYNNRLSRVCNIIKNINEEIEVLDD